MLDSDASFFLVPEFQSSRGARRTLGAPSSNLRLGVAPDADLCVASMPDPGTLSVAAKADICGKGANVVPTVDHTSEFLAFPTTDSFGLDSDDDGGTFLLAIDQDDAGFHSPDDMALIPDTTDPRAVTPRRPMRFTFAREAVEHSRQSLPIPNLFDCVFDDDRLTGPTIDPRLQRSRARARARLAAHEASLPPEARNLWCDDGSETALQCDTPSAITVTETPASDGSDGAAPRRAVRHLSVNRRVNEPRPDPALALDPLQNHLHQVREALYAADPDAETEPAPQPAPGRPALFLQLMVICLTVAFTRIILPLRSVMADPLSAILGISRGILAGQSGLRLPARAMAIIAVVFALAQTIPPSLM